jgi:hypothetical protein
MKPYFLLYNVVNVLGWSYVLIGTVQSLLTGKGGLWEDVGLVLTYTQSLAAMEILHAAFGLVRSPLFSTFVQVMSRLLIVWFYTVPAEACHTHWSLYVMVLSWCCIEVVRYSFYALQVYYDGKAQYIPFALFWLRYNLYMVLYPTGITGELLQMYVGLPHILSGSPFGFRLALMHFAIYLPFSPFVMKNMGRMGKRASKKRAAAINPPPPRPVVGVVWPETDQRTGRPKTTGTNRGIWEASFAAVDAALAAKVANERNWRFGYRKHVQNNVRLACESKANALKIARAGLAKAMSEFKYKHPDAAEAVPLQEAMDTFTEDKFDTYVVEGELPKKVKTLKVPYEGKSGAPYYNYKPNTLLEGDMLKKQLKKWAEYGTIEMSAAKAISDVVDNQDTWLDLSDKYFVLIGATSAMGPLEMLLEHGANIIAVDIDRKNTWETLITKARNSCGKMFIPVRQGELENLKGAEKSDEWYKNLAAVSGSNLLAATPEIRNWLVRIVPGEDLIIGNYTYLDGALHVQLSVAANAIIDSVCKTRGKASARGKRKKSTSIAFLCTPTDCHVIEKEAHDAMSENLVAAPLWQKLLSALYCGKGMVRNALKPIESRDKPGKHLHIVDGTVVAQGPNYSLAKRMQHWMAIVKRDEGHTVSTNIAPSTATISVVHAWTFAAAYGGMHHLKPMEVMYQETSNAVMGALLVHDVCNPDSFSNPLNKLNNPMELFKHGSFHGGIWRTGYALDSTSTVNVLAYLFGNYWFYISAGMGVFSSMMVWLVSGEVYGKDPTSGLVEMLMGGRQ